MTNPYFPEIHGIFGFGCMRFPKAGDEIDRAQVCQMVADLSKACIHHLS